MAGRRARNSALRNWLTRSSAISMRSSTPGYCARSYSMRAMDLSLARVLASTKLCACPGLSKSSRVRLRFEAAVRRRHLRYGSRPLGNGVRLVELLDLRQLVPSVFDIKMQAPVARRSPSL